MKVLPYVLILLLLLDVIVPVAGLTPQAVKAAATTHTISPPDALVTVQPTKTTLSIPHITIKSDPSGAEIWLFGKDQFIVTPFSSDIAPSVNLPPPHQQYSIALKYPGYNDYLETFTLDYGQSYTINAKLVPLTTTQLQAETPSEYNPPANPQPTTQQTPAPAASAGSQPSQSPAPGTGSLSVTTNPPGAGILVDGIPGGASPATIPGLPAGTHNLTITMPGYAELITQVNVVGGQTMEYSTTLLPATIPTKPKAPGFEGAAAGIAIACIIFLKRMT